MRRSVPSIARSAKTLLQATESGIVHAPSPPGEGLSLPATSCTNPLPCYTPCSESAGCPATSPAQQQCAAASAHRAFAAAPGATPAPGSPTAEAQAAITSSSQRTSRGSSSSTPGGGRGSLSPNGGPDPSSSGGGGGWFFPALTLAAAGGGYYAYTQKNNGTEGGGHKLPQGVSREQLDATQKAALDLLQKSKQKVQELLPAALGGTSKKTAPDAAKTPSSSSSSLAQEKQRDQDDAGFKMLPPGREDASAAAAAADAAASASAAARDSLSAAADEFPGSTEGAAATQQGEQAGFQRVGVCRAVLCCAVLLCWVAVGRFCEGVGRLLFEKERKSVERCGQGLAGMRLSAVRVNEQVIRLRTGSRHTHRSTKPRGPVVVIVMVNGVIMHICVCMWVLPCMAGPAVVLEDLGGLLDVQQVDLTPITDLFADVTGAHTRPPKLRGGWHWLSAKGNPLSNRVLGCTRAKGHL